MTKREQNNLIKAAFQESLAKYLKNLNGFEKVKDIASNLKVDEKEVRFAIPSVKDALADAGFMLVNKMAKGYRLGNEDEYRAEIYKSLQRSISHLGKAAKRLSLLKHSGKYLDIDFKGLIGATEKAADSISANLKTAELHTPKTHAEARIRNAGILPEFLKKEDASDSEYTSDDSY